MFRLLQLALLVVSSSVYGQYSIATIDKDWLNKAPLVIRGNEVRLTEVSETELLYEHKQVITVLKESARAEAGFFEIYEEGEKVKFKSMLVYDSFGKLIKKNKNGAESDVPYSGGSNFVEDPRRVKKLSPPEVSVPFTVEIQWEIRVPKSLFLPKWYPSISEDAYCEQATFNATLSDDFSILWRSSNLSYDSIKTKEGTSRTWKLTRYESNCDYFFVKPGEGNFPSLSIYPKQFAHHGYTGTLSDWKTFGNWNIKLAENRNDFELPQEISDSLKKLANAHDKLKYLYKCMQKQVHYTSIQLGIGGWQPQKSQFTWSNRFGDCKALSFLMQAMLEKVGIESHCVLVYADKSGAPRYSEAPIPKFNHMVLAALIDKDTVWLECTDNVFPAGYTGMFTANRKGLWLTKENSSLVSLPVLDENTNYILNKQFYQIDGEGNLIGSVSRTSSGAFIEDFISFAESVKSSKDIVNSDFTGKFSIANLKTHLNDTTLIGKESFIAALPKKVEFTTQRIKIPSSIRQLPFSLPKKDQKKICNDFLYIDYGFQYSDTLSFLLPDYKEIINLPSEVNVSNLFGEMQCSSKLAGNILTIYRSMILKHGLYESSNVKDLLELFRAFENSQNETILLLK